VASIYTIDWRDVVEAGLTTLAPVGRPISRVSTFALPGRPDQPGPHYGLVLWHVSEAAALR